MTVDPIKRGRVREGIRVSTYALLFSSAFLGMTVDYVIPYALFLGASTAVVGLLASVPVLLGSLAQLKTAWAARKTGRKKLCVFTSSLHGLLWLPVILTAFMPSGAGITLFVVLFTLITVAGSFEIPAWSSMLSDLIPPGKRGSYFGWRMSVSGFVYIACSACAAFVLSFFRRTNPALGFAGIFLLAAVFRLISSYYISRMYEKPGKLPHEVFPFSGFLRGLRSDNFARFTLFQSGMNFALGIAAPYFAVYMLRELAFSYVDYMTVILAGTVTIFALCRRWGSQADEVGNVRVMKLTSMLMPLVPILWLFSHNIAYLVVIQVFAGFLFSGYTISSSNFIYDAVPPSRRPCSIAYFNVFNGIALCGGALLGGVLIDRLPGVFYGQSVFTVFILSALLRLLARVFLCRGITEVRSSRTVPAIYLFTYVGGIRPLVGFTRGAQRIMRRIFSA